MDNSSSKVKVDVIYDSDTNRDVSICKVPGKDALFFTSKLAIDADGSPNAYNQNDTGLDKLEYAGHPGDWWALATKDDGEPCIQGNNDAAPGGYISTTALSDETKSNCDYRKYVNSEEIPYIALPPAFKHWGVHVGDFGMVINLNNMKMSSVIYADIGPAEKIGEGSIALANALGINSKPRTGGADQNIFYLIFPNSGEGSNKLRTLDEIIQNGQKLFESWGGIEQVNRVLH